MPLYPTSNEGLEIKIAHGNHLITHTHKKLAHSSHKKAGHANQKKGLVYNNNEETIKKKKPITAQIAYIKGRLQGKNVP